METFAFNQRPDIPVVLPEKFRIRIRVLVKCCYDWMILSSPSVSFSATVC